VSHFPYRSVPEPSVKPNDVMVPISSLRTGRALRPFSCSNLGLAWPAVKKSVYHIAGTNLMVRDILSNLRPPVDLAMNLVVGW